MKFMPTTIEQSLNKNPIFSIIKIKNKKKWTKEDDKLLLKLAEQFEAKNWKRISACFSKRSALQCFSRYKRIRPGLVHGCWKKEDDAKIIELVNTYGKSWSKISKVFRSRNGKQIRDRYLNVLDPNINKTKFTAQEDEKLIRLYLRFGNKWATIAGFFDDRTADMIKNRFHSSLKKLILGNNKTIDRNILKVILHINYLEYRSY
jgi:hypothetical protein